MPFPLFILFFLSLFSLSSTAEDAYDVDNLFDMSLDELLNINVSVGSHLKQNKLSAGATVEHIEPQDWRTTGSKNMWEAINHQPSLTIGKQIAVTPGIAIRGLMINPGVRGIAMLIDDIPINSLSYSTGLYHLENMGLGTLSNIEMIRGPGSAIYGADAFQGVLALSTPSYEKDQADVQVATGTDDYSRTAIQLAKRLAEPLTLNLNMEASEDNQPIDYLYGTGAGWLDSNRTQHDSLDENFEAESISSNLGYQASEKLKFNAGVIYNTHENERLWLVDSGLALRHGSDTNFVLGKLAVNYLLPMEMQLHSKLYQFKSSVTWDDFLDFDEEKKGFDIYLRQEENEFNTQWVLGYTYSKAEITKAVYPFWGPLIVDSTQGYYRKLNSIYFESRTGFYEDSLELLLGGRVDDYSDFDRHTSPRLGLIYYPAADTAIKLLYGNAFRSPAGSEIAADPGPGFRSVFGDSDMKPETLDTYELIYMRSTPSSSIEAVAFYTKLTDGILEVPMPASDPRFVAGNSHLIYANLAEAETYGLEFKYGRLIDNLKVDINISWAHGENTQQNYDYDGYPDWIANLQLGYYWQEYDINIYMTNRLELERKTFQRTDLSQQSTDLKNYYRGDFHIAKKIDKHWNVSLDVLNLLNNDSYPMSNFDASETLRQTPDGSLVFSVKYSH